MTTIEHPLVQAKARSAVLRRKGSKQPPLRTAQTLFDSLKMHLESELGDQGHAARLAQLIAHELLVWKVPTGDLAAVNGLIAFSFGNRLLEGGATAP